MGNETRQLPQAAVDAIASRLAALPDLRLPAQLRGGTTEQRKREYVQALLLHDPGVFLERHGDSLTAGERGHFQALRADYEVDFYLRTLEDGEDERKRGQAARNRRVAFMARLEREGAYFSEKEMRDRQPGMYHQYVGQYRPPEVPQGAAEGCQAGSILADSIMRGQEELAMRERAEAEERLWGQQAAVLAAQESEEEESESEEEHGVDAGGGVGEQPAGGRRAEPPAQQQQQQQGQLGGGLRQQQPQLEAASAAPAAQQAGGSGSTAPGCTAQGGGSGGGSGDGSGGNGAMGEEDEEEAGEGAAEFVHISAEEQHENAAAFLDLMKQRFLAGQDTGVDYAAIDADAELDDDWAEQAGRDAEDKYFDD